MAKKQPVPLTTLFSLMPDGLPPQILSDEGWYVKLSCPMCQAAYLREKSTLVRTRLKGTSDGMSCSQSCARKRYHTLNPGASYFNRIPMEQRGNPTGTVRSEEYKANMSALLKAKGHRPPVRGGNGTGMTEAERLVAAVLPACWVWNYPVALGRRQDGFPTNYKIDFANPSTKQGLEVDGHSHNMSARKLQDRKKEAKLAELGWSVLRITNREVLSMCTTSKLKTYLTTLLTET